MKLSLEANLTDLNNLRGSFKTKSLETYLITLLFKSFNPLKGSSIFLKSNFSLFKLNAIEFIVKSLIERSLISPSFPPEYFVMSMFNFVLLFIILKVSNPWF